MPADPRFPAQQVYNFPYPGQAGQPVPVAPHQGAPYPQAPYSTDSANRQPHVTTLGQAPPSPRLRDDPQFYNYQKVPAFYTLEIILGGEVGDTQGGSVPLRPEAFICERVTWAASEQPSDYTADGSTGITLGGSPQGRAVTVSWGDEFTRFLNQTPCLLAALFGDANGFLDIPRGILFQGRQTLNANLTRVRPTPQNDPPQDLLFHLSFQGVGLLPTNVAQSGSAG